jgi:DNA anti-recombination protein RmuC
MKEAVVNAQKTCDKMVLEAEAKCAQMLKNASATAAASAATAAAQNNDAAIAAENERVEEARRAAAAKINELQEQLRSCIQALDRIKNANAPAAPVKAEPVKPAFDYDSDDVASEISKNLENLVGTTEDVAPKAEPKHPVNDTTTSKFSTMNLQFGRNFDLRK